MAPPRSIAPPDDDLIALIDHQIGLTGKSPTVRELADLIGLASPAPMHRHLERLRRAGRVTWEPNRNRTLRTLPGSVSSTETSPEAVSA